MSLNTLKKPLISMLFLFLPLIAFAQSGRTQSVALVPFWGDDEQFIQEFGEVLHEAVGNMQGYRPVIIDMTNLPDDVPEGGFPPYICPSPSLTKTNPLAITGELTPDPDDDEFWHLRLYLWEMTDTRLVFSDELTAYEREEAEAAMPGMLDWLFSWLKRGGSGEGENIDLSDLYGQGKHVFITTAMPLHWIYIGGRAGWTPRMQRSPDVLDKEGWEDPDKIYEYNGNDSFSAALSVTLALFPESVPLFSRLNLQLEGIYNYDHDIGNNINYKRKPITVMTVTPTLLLKTQLIRHGDMLLSSFLGGYTAFFLNDYIGFTPLKSFPVPFPLGGTAGLSFGAKLGTAPGLFFIDARFSMDFYHTVVKKDEGYYGWVIDEGYNRWAVTISIGYEYGLIRKK